tara:strand:+ start:349 stop:612 length:264 start_codon:yes stop_codon:yes gene_type:complete
MNKKKKGNLTEEEFTSVKQQQQKSNTIVQEIGAIETRKHALLHEIAALNEDIGEYKNVLEKKYGSITISLEDGSWERIKEDVQNKKD